MDSITRDTYAQLNVYRLLLEALYLEFVGSNPEAVERMRSYVLSRIKDPDLMEISDPNQHSEAEEIQPQAFEAAHAFFDRFAGLLAPPVPKDSKESSKPTDNDDGFPF